uniref:Uncharacterized protein n=1 Tax=Rhizophora mucronata TaxID=61149 RepID=A0A2P2QJ77_RHIMU
MVSLGKSIDLCPFSLFFNARASNQDSREQGF